MEQSWSVHQYLSIPNRSTVKPDDLSHILNHLGEDREAGYNAVVPPLNSLT